MKKLLFICFSLMACLAVGQVKGGNGNALRIELQSFLAVCGEEKVNVLWKTGSEDVDGCFTIEKSKDGINFTKVVDVPYVAISSSNTNFTATDCTPTKGISYYRLKQTDKIGGVYAYSTIVSVDFTPQKNITLYPNPLLVSNNLNIDISGFENEEVTVVLRNTQGKEFVSKVLLAKESNDVFILDETKALLPGMYVVTASADNKTYNYRLLVK
ncbi:MAG TPA: T9SS type A sorting domain-containing protein [Bacteroidia bacterium]|jgi:hypothetical protein|nr:T9SS type A sorting domain-containing protein [Bacteroidia bacterium]